MAQDLLKVEHLAASVEDAEILKDVSLRIGRGETHVIMGPNGAGKSTLAGVLMGNPAYTVTGGSALWEGKPVRVWSFRKEVKAALETLDMDPSYAERDLNVGFSGGEKKKAEILQLLLLKPSLAILDETDSGLDVDAVRTVSKGIEAFQADKSASLLIITHNAAILSALKVDAVHILAGGKIVAEGGPELVDKITKEGFAAYEGEA